MKWLKVGAVGSLCAVGLATLIVLAIQAIMPRPLSVIQPNQTEIEYQAPLVLQADTSSKTKYGTLFVVMDSMIPIRGEINKDTSEIIAQAILTLTAHGDPVYLMIDSPGGEVTAGRQIIEAIEGARGPVYTVCTSMCASMAAFIFQYGKKRYITPSGQLMHHPAYGGFYGNVDQVLTEAAMIKAYVDEIEVHVAKRLKMDLKEYKYLSASQNIWLRARDAKERGYADQVVYVQYVR